MEKKNAGKRKRVVDQVEEVIAPFAEAHAFEVVDIEFVKEGPYRYLRVTIDKDTPVTLEDCEQVSTYLNGKLDELDPIEEQYFLEVSSPGVERVLKRPEDFEKFKGRTIQLNLYQSFEGQKIVVGILEGLASGNVLVRKEGQSQMQIPMSMVSKAHLVVTFN